MSRETLRTFLNDVLGLKQDDKISYSLDAESGGKVDAFGHHLFVAGDDLGVDPNTGEPLIDSEKGLLGNYLKFIVDQEGNRYTVKGGNQVSSRAHDRGAPLSNLSDEGFVKQGTTAAASINSYSNSGYLNNEVGNLSDLVDKLGQTPEGTHELLSAIQGNNLTSTNNVFVPSSEENDLLDTARETLKNFNRFSPDNPGAAFKDNGATLTSFEAGIHRPAGTFTSQSKMGEFDDNPNNEAVFTLDKLKKIGKSLLLKSGGWDLGEDPGGSTDPDLATLAAKTLPTLSVDADSIRAKNAFGAPTNETGGSTRNGKNDALASRDRVQSTFYNDTLRFDGKNKKILKLKSIIALIALRNSVDSIFETLATIAGAELTTPSNTYNGRGPHVLGQHDISATDLVDFLQKNVLTKTKYSYKQSFETGMKILFDIEEVDQVSDTAGTTDYFDDTASYWLSVAYASLRRAESALSMIETAPDDPVDSLNYVLKILKEERLLKFMNVIAVMGDIHLQRTGGNTSRDAIKNTTTPYQVDALPDSPATRVAKGRKRNGFTAVEQTMSSRQLPSMYMLPTNVLKAAVEMNNIFTGQNPAKGMLGSGLIDKTYLDQNLDKSFNRIPNDVAMELEDRLEAEYVPFYLQDLRTNEIIAFHAFLSELSDTISPKFDSTTGYGRLDPVQTYNTTTRSVGVTFTLLATSREDFDEMWFKINKLVTMVYPQWTKGDLMTSTDGSFVQPFSQVIGATPIVRLRVGDVIKSNYSKFNLARIFGIGDNDVKAPGERGEKIADNANKSQEQIDNEGILGSFGAAEFFKHSYLSLEHSFFKKVMKAFYGLYGTPLQYKNAGLVSGPPIDNTIVFDAASDFLVNGFANPLSVSLILNQLRDPDLDPTIASPSVSTTGLANAISDGVTSLENSTGAVGYSFGTIVKLRPTMGKGYKVVDDDGQEVERIFVDRHYDVFVRGQFWAFNRPDTEVKKAAVTSDALLSGQTRPGFNTKRTKYKVQIIDLSAPVDAIGKILDVYHTDLQPDYSNIFNTRVAPLLAIANPAAAAGSLVKNVALQTAPSLGISESTLNSLLSDDQTGLLQSKAEKFMTATNADGSTNNPITRAFESSSGRGLAGTLGNISFDWLDDSFAWETDFNSRAPVGVKIKLSLDVIHDIPPGLDHSGFNRAPLYNVGGVMEHVAGDPNGRINSARSSYRKRGQGSIRRYKSSGG